MKKEINFGIGFISGRPNVCHVINNYYKFILEQLDEADVKVNLTIFILFDLKYQHTTRIDFYCILPEVYKNINIKYITPEDIVETKKKIISQHNMSAEDVDLLIGEGYAKARNTILFYALKRKMDYLMFWDDDEYPLANVKKGEEIEWVKQFNVLEHIKNIDNADVTMGYRCGMMNPVPYIKYNENITEDDYHAFINGLENEVINWEKIKELREKNTCISYAEEEIINKKRKQEYFEGMGKDTFILASGICLNLTHLDKLPAFYNPPEGRGEDTFFSCALGRKGARVLRVPTYHFHDSFLKYTGLMKNRFPKKLSAISLDDTGIEQRFLKTTIGWTKYKPLLYYITNKENYRKIIDDTRENFKNSVLKVNTAFETCDFSCLIDVLNTYDKNVEKHYQEYLKVTEIWDKLKHEV